MRLSPSRPLLVIASALVAGACIAAALLSAPRPALSQASAQIAGYAWSDGIGWISMSGSNYGLAIDSSGTVTGYAWSDGIGWISANPSDLSGCPSSPCTATISGGKLTGWLRAVAGESGSTGGWDGWISLSGSNYGVSLNETTGAFSGYAWGSTDVGWIDWEYATSAYTEVPPCQNTQGNYCADSSGNPNDTGPQIWSKNAQCATTYVSTCSYQCASGSCVAPPSPQGTLTGGAAIAANPSIVPAGSTTIISWSVENVQSCSVSGSNGDGPWSGASGIQTSASILAQTIYTLSCTDLSGNPFTQSVTVNIIPGFREI